MSNFIQIYIDDPTKTVEIYLNSELIKSGTYSEFYELYDGYGYSQAYRGYIDELSLVLDNCEIVTHTYKHS